MNLTKRSVFKQLHILSIVLNIVIYPTSITPAPYDVFFPPLPPDFYNGPPMCAPILCPVIICAEGFTFMEDPTGCTCPRCECSPRFCPYIDCGKNDTMIPRCGCPYCEVPGTTMINNVNTTGIVITENSASSESTNIERETEFIDKLTTSTPATTTTTTTTSNTEINTKITSPVNIETETESKITNKMSTTSSATTITTESSTSSSSSTKTAGLTSSRVVG